MTGSLLVVLGLQWALLLLLALLLLVALRQIGVLHERMGPVGALVLAGGPAVGSLAPTFDLTALDGRRVSIGTPQGRAILLFFLSPKCPVCKSLAPVVKSMAARRSSTLDLVLASDGDHEAQLRMVRELRLEAFPLVLSTPLGVAFQVSRLPYAVLLRADGRIAAKGLVNNREHLESLFEAEARGVASLQAFLADAPPALAITPRNRKTADDFQG
ncbi:MAG: redoxin domain-containing protein [Phenylobacterium sp.]|uniref:redoxin family protein n=1 Tax=Phenylobacterium sp. TaxID=1871053 RepID=UPI002732C123|nr:redoxin family protein [Phenylobacterium sp.]MDP3749564.1 redoxin domain-containing protein [Phenylobacterium sp.]